MILTKADKFGTVPFLGVFCAHLISFLTLVGTCEDDA